LLRRMTIFNQPSRTGLDLVEIFPPSAFTVNPFLDGAVLARGVLKMGCFTRNRRTASQSNISIPLAKGAYSDLKLGKLKSPTNIGLNRKDLIFSGRPSSSFPDIHEISRALLLLFLALFSVPGLLPNLD